MPARSTINTLKKQVNLVNRPPKVDGRNLSKCVFDGPDTGSIGSRVKIIALGKVEAVRIGGKV